MGKVNQVKDSSGTVINPAKEGGTQKLLSKDGMKLLDLVDHNIGFTGAENGIVIFGYKVGGSKIFALPVAADADSPANKSAIIVPVGKYEIDDGIIAKDQVTLLVINLNYVYDAGNTQWVPMTQP